MHVTIEYVILIPLLILQMFLFPMVVTGMMNTWVDSRQTIALQETAGHMGSNIQQVYISLNHTSIQDGNLVSDLSLQQKYIEGYAYTANATLRTVSDSSSNSTKVLDVTLTLVGTSIKTTSSVTLGQNVVWVNSTFASNANQTCLIAQKTAGVITFSFGAGA